GREGFWLILTAKGAEMRSKVERQSEEAEKAVRDIRRATRRQYSAEEKVRIVIAGLRGEDSVAELCRKEGINQNLYYRWSKDFAEFRLQLTLPERLWSPLMRNLSAELRHNSLITAKYLCQAGLVGGGRSPGRTPLRQPVIRLTP